MAPIDDISTISYAMSLRIFFQLNHSPEFWKIAERLYLGLELNVQTTCETIYKVRNEFADNMVLVLLRYWGQPSYLKAFFWDGLVKHKTPLIIPSYVETPNGKKKDGIYTTFGIRI